MKMGWCEVQWHHHPKVIRDLIRVGRMRPKMKACYENAARICLAALEQGVEGVRYVEGVVTSKACGLPIRHAWVTLNGEVVELTLEDEDYDHRPYRELTPLEVLHTTIKHGAYGSWFASDEDAPEWWRWALG